MVYLLYEVILVFETGKNFISCKTALMAFMNYS